MTVIVKLNQDEVRVCTMLAVERWLTKFNSTDKPNYAAGKAAGRLEPELNANIRANVAEWAAAKHYNISWNVPWYPNELHTKRNSIPDAGTKVEVRTVRTQNGIPVWTKDSGKTIVGAKVLDTEYFSEVEIFGFYLADSAYKDEWKDESIQGWRIPIGEFTNAQQE
ncbi:hypothetical protein uvFWCGRAMDCOMC455_051 [Freshwater phage uvFW-CGR-AMD-COM-C455]|nr:hypothetical protein uvFWCGRAMDCOMC455_051 [Freshwater phage uvFW-CGR-AMD-COM-C455]